MSDMIERMARAYWEGRQPTTGPQTPWDELHGFTKGMLRLDARYVLERMRDCDAGSPAMLVAGKTALFSCSEDPELEDARGCWQAMIDAALK